MIKDFRSVVVCVNYVIIFSDFGFYFSVRIDISDGVKFFNVVFF